MSHRITIEQNVEILKRYAFLERACMRTLAGWLPGVPEWDAKNQFGLHIWESADAADHIAAACASCASSRSAAQSGLEQVAAALDRAQNTAEVIATVPGRQVLPRLPQPSRSPGRTSTTRQ